MVKKYHTEEERLEAQRQARIKYQQSDKFKAAQKKYFSSKKGKAAIKKYFKSEKGKNTINSWRRIKLKIDPFYRVRNSLSARIGQYLRQKNSKKISSVTQLIGCSKDQLIKHLESKFYTNKETNESMTWDNYGRGGWEVDHKMPIDSFKDQDITLLETQKKIMHYTNLQPMWGNENRAKSNKILND
jgi:hypothetical protein